MVNAVVAILLAGTAVQTPPGGGGLAESSRQLGGWLFMRLPDSDDCAIATTYEDSSFLSMHWRPRTKDMQVIYEDPAFKALKVDATYKLSLYFRKKSGLDDGWGEVDVTGIKTSDGVPGFKFGLIGDVALSDIAASTAIAFFRDGKLVASLSLAGSSAAIAAVRQCSAEIVKNHPIDPFED